MAEGYPLSLQMPWAAAMASKRLTRIQSPPQLAQSTAKVQVATNTALSTGRRSTSKHGSIHSRWGAWEL